MAQQCSTPGCITILSTDNARTTTICYPCQDKLRELAWENPEKPKLPIVIPSRKRKPDEIERDYRLVMQAVREHTNGPFRARHLSPFLMLQRTMISQLIQRAQRRGELVPVDRKRGSNGGRVMVWELTERLERREEIAS